MSLPVVTPIGIQDGLWSATISSADRDMPKITVQHLGESVESLRMERRGAGAWALDVKIPSTAIADGVQTFLVIHEPDGETLASFTLLVGEALGEDIRAEVDLLRAELDMLKRAFRRHCNETA